MHNWSEGDAVDWAGISDAAAFIGRGLRKWRVDVRQYKEKFGTVRVYCTLGLVGWQQLTHPGHVFRRWPRWLWKLSLTRPATWALQQLNRVVLPLHKYLYKHYYRKARERWPHLAEEIYRGADYYELLGAKVKRMGEYGGGRIWWPEWDKEPKDEWDT